MTFLNTLRKYWYIVVSVVVFVTIASFIVSIIQTPEYKSSVQLLVIQKQKDNADAYTATRSAETVAGILANVIYTSTFFDQVIASGFEIDKNTFSTDLEERKKEWKRAVNATVVGDTGTIQIDVYDNNRNQAEQIAYAIAYVIINNGEEYHGAASQIETKLIDAPITTDKIARPNILLNIGAGLVLGIMTSLAIIFLLSERKPKEEYTKGLEVQTLPKIKPKKKSVEKNIVKEPSKYIERAKKIVKKQPSASMKVKERIAAELKDYNKNKPQEIITSNVTAKKQSKKELKKVNNQEKIHDRMASGIGNIGYNEQEDRSDDKVIYTPEEIQANYQKAEEDKYSPDRVEKWIKTGKFE